MLVVNVPVGLDGLCMTSLTAIFDEMCTHARLSLAVELLACVLFHCLSSDMAVYDAMCNPSYKWHLYAYHYINTYVNFDSQQTEAARDVGAGANRVLFVGFVCLVPYINYIAVMNIPRRNQSISRLTSVW